MRLAPTTCLSAALLTAGAALAQVEVATQDGLAIGFDTATGRLASLKIDGAELSLLDRFGGFFVRDATRLAEMPATAPQLLPNSSFETDSPPDGMPDYWIFQDGWLRGATLAYGTDAFDGGRSVTIRSFAGGQLYSPDVPVVPGTRYVLQIRHKGGAAVVPYVVWKTDTGDYLGYAGGLVSRAAPAWKAAAFVFTAPAAAGLADAGFVSVEDADVTLDLARLYPAPPEAFSEVRAAVTATAGGAAMTASLPALGLDFRADILARPDRIDIEARLSDTSGTDRALETGLIVPVLARTWWDTIRDFRVVTDVGYGQSFAYTVWGGIYQDGPWGVDRSIYPLAAVGLGGSAGLALAYDVALGPQDVRFFHSTYPGESFTARFRLGLAAEPVRYPRQATFRLSLMRADGEATFRSALERLYRAFPAAFADRFPGLGGWMPWSRASSVADLADFGVDVHTSDAEVGSDDAAGIATLGYLPSWDYWLPLGDFTARPTLQEARDRLLFNATQSGVDPTLQADARTVMVSGLHDPSGAALLEVYQAGWMPGSGWAAVCGVDPDPEVSDRGGQGWTSRFAAYRAALDARFASAQGAGATLDGAFFDWFRSWHDGEWNHRREHWETVDAPLSFDPVTLTPALAEANGHWEAVREIAADLRGRGLYTMARDVHIPSFWATGVLDLFGEAVDWTAGEDSDQTLAFFRSVAGKKPYGLLLDGDLQGLDFGHVLRRNLLYGLLAVPDWDTAGGRYFWQDAALVARERPRYRRFVPLYRLERQAGWEPLTHATSSAGEVRLERWGTKAGGMLLYSAWNSGAADAATIVRIDLAALGLLPGEVGRVVDLVEAGVVPGTAVGGSLELADTLAADAARLYHVHLAAEAQVQLRAVKRGADVSLVWNDAGRALYEVLGSGAPDLAGAAVSLATSAAATDPGAVGTPGLRFYSVE